MATRAHELRQGERLRICETALTKILELCEAVYTLDFVHLLQQELLKVKAKAETALEGRRVFRPGRAPEGAASAKKGARPNG